MTAEICNVRPFAVYEDIRDTIRFLISAVSLSQPTHHYGLEHALFDKLIVTRDVCHNLQRQDSSKHQKPDQYLFTASELVNA